MVLVIPASRVRTVELFVSELDIFERRGRWPDGESKIFQVVVSADADSLAHCRIGWIARRAPESAAFGANPCLSVAKAVIASRTLNRSR